MNSYILLRNNKESSSLSLDALLQSGLKPTDLIWVECQSVCWQHPHEIAELKHLIADNISQPIVQTKIQTVESNINFKEIIPEKKVDKKLVFTELPSAPDPVKKQLLGNAVLSDIHKYSGLSVSHKELTEKEANESTIKYSRPLDEIKEMYVKNLEKQRQSKKSSIKIKWPKEFKKMAGYAGLVVAGALLMLLINNIGDKRSAPVKKTDFQQPIANRADDIVISEPVTKITQENVDNHNKVLTDHVSISAGEKVKSSVQSQKPSVVDKEIEKGERQVFSKQKIENRSQDGEEIAELKPESAANISSKLSLKVNDYIVGSFGGIRNLEITLQNNSKYLLDRVSTELQYLNPEGIILKTEHIYFQSIPAGGKETVAVKKSKRGVKINYKITNIESKLINNVTAGL